MKRRYFGTDGIRGQSNIFPMTPDLAMRSALQWEPFSETALTDTGW